MIMKLKLTIKKYSIYKNAYLWSENFLRYRKSNTIFYKLKSKFKDISILESVIGGENKGRYSIIFFNIVENVEIYENYALKNNKKIKISSPNNYLKVNEVSKIDPLNIKQNIVNLIYSTIINQLKNDYEIEVNNQEILNL